MDEPTPSAAEKQEDYGDVCMKLEATLRHWQNAIRDELIKLSGNDKIDGAGCDSGDPLDFTLAEIRQAWQSRHSRQAVDRQEWQNSVRKAARYLSDPLEPRGLTETEAVITEVCNAELAAEREKLTDANVAFEESELLRRNLQQELESERNPNMDGSLAFHLAEIQHSLAAERQRAEKAEAAANHNADISDSIARASKQVEESLRATLAATHKAHRIERMRLTADYIRELDAKLEQINAQAGTIKQVEREREVALQDSYHKGKQLLSALAAIEKHNKHTHEWKCEGEINVDLSLLHQHDAEVKAQWEKERSS